MTDVFRSLYCCPELHPPQQMGKGEKCKNQVRKDNAAADPDIKTAEASTLLCECQILRDQVVVDIRASRGCHHGGAARWLAHLQAGRVGSLVLECVCATSAPASGIDWFQASCTHAGDLDEGDGAHLYLRSVCLLAANRISQ